MLTLFKSAGLDAFSRDFPGKLLTVQELAVPSDQPRPLRSDDSDGMGITPLTHAHSQRIYIYNIIYIYIIYIYL